MRRLNTQLNKQTNKKSVNVPKVFQPTNKKMWRYPLRIFFQFCTPPPPDGRVCFRVGSRARRGWGGGAGAGGLWCGGGASRPLFFRGGGGGGGGGGGIQIFNIEKKISKRNIPLIFHADIISTLYT